MIIIHEELQVRPHLHKLPFMRSSAVDQAIGETMLLPFSPFLTLSGSLLWEWTLLILELGQSSLRDLLMTKDLLSFLPEALTLRHLRNWPLVPHLIGLIR